MNNSPSYLEMAGMNRFPSNLDMTEIIRGRSWSSPKPIIHPLGFDQDLHVNYQGPAPKQGTIPIETHQDKEPTPGQRTKEGNTRRNAETLESASSHSKRTNFDHRVDEEIRRQTSSEYPRNTVERVEGQVGGAIDPVRTTPKGLDVPRTPKEELRNQLIEMEAKHELGVRDQLGVRYHDVTKDMSKTKKRIGRGVAALGVTVVQQSFNGENDGVYETVGKTAAVYGAMSFAEHKLDKWAVSGTAKKKILENLDVVKKEESIRYNDKERHYLKQNRHIEERGAKRFRQMRGGLGIAVASIAVGGLLDLGVDAKHHLDVEGQKADLRQRNEQSMQQAAQKRQENGYGHIDMGQIAIDMFNQRTGHYKMGNAKFQ